MINNLFKIIVCLLLLTGILYFLGYDALGGVVFSVLEWIASAIMSVLRPIFELLESFAENWRNR